MNQYALDIQKVQRFLPHRPPFLLIDRVLSIEPQGDLSIINGHPSKEGTRVVALKNMTINEGFFVGHFPGYPVTPGVLMLEMMAQAASFSTYPFLEWDLDRLARDFKCILVGVNDARFRKLVVPGDTIQIETVVTKCRGKLWIFDCKAKVEGLLVAEAEVMANLLPNGGET